MPEGTTYDWKEPVDTTTPGDTTGTVVVTYPDGTKDEVEVKVTVLDTVAPPTDAETHTPQGQDITVNKGETPNAEHGIANKDKLPQGTAYDWKTPVDTSEAGEKSGTVVVTYPDGSKDEVEVKVTVVDTATPTPQGQDITVNKGETPNAADGIANEDELPEGTTYDWKDPVDTTTPGEKQGTIVVTYPDGTSEEVVVKVTVVDPVTTPTDAETYNPRGQDITVNKGETPNAADGIANKGELPEGTIYDWKEPVDTTTSGEKQGTIVVTYPDGTSEEVAVKVTVVEPVTPPSDAETYDPQGQDITVNKGETPNAEDGIANKDKLPEGTTYYWKETVDTSEAGEKTGTVVVKYPDSSTDEVEVTVVVKDTGADDADKYDPQGQGITVNKGKTPNAADGIANKDDMPEGTTYDWKELVDTTTPGDKTGTIVVTYPDGTKDEVEVKVTVVDPADKTGSLTVTKTVSGSGSDQNKAFTFTVTLDKKDLSGTYGDMAFSNGVATFTLKNGESMTAVGLLAGVSYTVEESDNSGYTVTKTNATGTIQTGATATAAFVNYKGGSGGSGGSSGGDTSDPEGGVKITKTVTGNKAPAQSISYEFKVWVKSSGGSAVSENVSYKLVKADGTTENGSLTIGKDGYSFSLKNGESMTFSRIDSDRNVEVREITTGSFTTTAKGLTDGICEISSDSTKTVEFVNDYGNTSSGGDDPDDPTPTDPKPTNPNPPKPPERHLDKVPQTGDHSNMGLWIALAALSMLGFIGTVLFNKTMLRRSSR